VQILIASSDIITELDGVPVRVWYGTTENGTRCLLFVHRIMVDDCAASEFGRELVEQPPPTAIGAPQPRN
jgi:hypothetical protein